MTPARYKTPQVYAGDSRSDRPLFSPTMAAPSPQDAIVAALMELKRLVDEGATVAPATAGACSTAELLKMPVLQAPLDVDAIAAELLSAGSHIRLLQSESRAQKKSIAQLRAEVVQLRKELRGGDSGGVDAPAEAPPAAPAAAVEEV